MLEVAVIAALYVESGGAYFGLPGVDPWDATRDAARRAAEAKGWTYKARLPTRLRNATPVPFRDLLLRLAAGAV